MMKLGIVVAMVVLGMVGCAEEQDNPAITATTEAEAEATISVTMVEYEFEGIPETLPVTETTFALENAGEEDHEMALSLITGDQTVEELLELPEEEVNQHIEDVGHAHARPGGSAELTAELEPGRYGYVCFIPAPDGTPHAFLGMAGEFTVA